MTTRIKLRRDTAANWLAANPILSAGEPGLETDTGKIKYGDGVTAYTDLPHAGGDQLVSETAITVQTGDAQRWLTRLRREEDSNTDDNSAGVFINNVYYDNEGNVIATAVVDLNDDGVAVFKFSPAGNLIWKYVLEGYGAGVYPQGGLAIDSNNDIWLTIYPSNSATGLMKLSGADGSVLYTNTFWNDEEGGSESYAIDFDSDDNIVLVGSVGYEGSGAKIALMKVTGTGNNIGDIIWQKQITPDGNWAAGFGIAVDNTDNIIISGTSQNSDGVDKMYVVSFDSNGNTNWQKSIELNANDSGNGSAVDTDSIGNIYVTGTLLVKSNTVDNGPFGQSLKSNAIAIVSLDINGDVRWARRVGPGQCSWVGSGITVGDDGDLYLVASTVQYKKGGNTNDTGIWDPSIILARYNAQNGQVVWQRYWNNPEAQDVPAGPLNASNGSYFDNYNWAGHGIDVQKDKIVIGGSTRMGASDFDTWIWASQHNFSQGFVAQFDTDASEFKTDGYELTTSRVPGKLITNEVYTVSEEYSIANSDTYSDNILNGIDVNPANISVRKSASKTNTWTFERNGDLATPTDANIKLNQTQLGYANMYGPWENYNDDIWYQSVVRDSEGCAYTLGSNYWGNSYAYVTKYAPTGERIWEYSIQGSQNAEFFISWNDGVYTLEYINSAGDYYRVGDKVTISGYDLYGDYTNNLVLNVDSIYGNEVGGILSASVVSGTPISGSNATYATDYQADGEGYVESIALDPKTGNLKLTITNNTYNGNSLDNSWSQTLIHTIDSASGALIDTVALTDSGDVYGNAVSIDADGNWAVAGEKYNEYGELGSLNPLAGSGAGKIAVAKSDFTEHYPGDAETYYGDVWIYGGDVIDQTWITDLNWYTGLTTTVRQGSGATFDVTADGAGGYSVLTAGTFWLNFSLQDFTDTTLLDSNNLTKNSDNFTVTDSLFGRYLTIVAGNLATSIRNTFADGSTIPVTWGAGSTSLSGYAKVSFNGDDTIQFTATDAAGGAVAGTWYFPAQLNVMAAVGSNYRVGHKILIDGSNLGGATTTNDLTITVTSASGDGAIVGVSVQGGTSTGSGSYTGVSGSNYNTGSGAAFNMGFRPITGKPTGNWNFSAGGSNYVVGDVLTIAGTQFIGGTSPANDITLTVSGVSGDAVNDLQFDSGDGATQHINADYLLILTNDSTDYSSGTGYAAKVNLGGEAFVATANWAKVIGGPSGDYFNNLAHDSDGNIIAVGYGRYDVNYGQALVVKYNGSTGAVMWSVAVNPREEWAENTGVVVLSDDSIVVVGNFWDYGNTYNYMTFVTKLDSDGNIVWQNGIINDDDSETYYPSVAVDPATDEIVLTNAFYCYDDRISYEQAWSIIKMDSDGEILWKRVWGTYNNSTYQNYNSPGKAISISGDKFTIAGYTYATVDDYYNACMVTLPLDGSGLGPHSIWTYYEPNDDKFKQLRLNTTAQSFTPNVTNASLVSDVPNKLYFATYPDDNFNLYRDVISSEDGGAIEFADGSKQTFSAAIKPQVKVYDEYYLRPEDAGRHLYARNSYNYIYIPYWERVTLPVGYTITIVNRSGGNLYLQNEYGNVQGRMFISGSNTETWAVGISDNGSGQMVTLMKIEEGEWVEDGDSHGDRWMIVGSDVWND